MTNFIPIFPLGVILYPQEKMHLHIFEPRYKQLIAECHALQKPFGIPVILNDRLQDMGALAEVTEIVKTYETGEMDINIRAIKIFRILELIKAVPDKLYSGAIVHYPDNKENDGRPKLVDAIM
ncbi:MAG: LON peptidase substrate-binding domain-containing protein, partial [Chitinophagaceae bacterium]|nr:LON peptidase substrate-binding domain-containing protein [Chitinophagaceae bacterium]